MDDEGATAATVTVTVTSRIQLTGLAVSAQSKEEISGASVSSVSSQRAKISPHLTVPGRGRIFKQTLCTEFNTQLSSGLVLSADRLVRVQQVCKQESAIDRGGQESLSLQSDVAMVFSENGTFK